VALADAINWSRDNKLIRASRQPLTGTVSAVSGRTRPPSVCPGSAAAAVSPGPFAAAVLDPDVG
ncbi:hypothetical protein ABZ676_31355, partial [Streptomyces sp. NPDC006999]